MEPLGACSKPTSPLGWISDDLEMQALSKLEFSHWEMRGYVFHSDFLSAFYVPIIVLVPEVAKPASPTS